jgi:hypothetical protein
MAMIIFGVVWNWNIWLINGCICGGGVVGGTVRVVCVEVNGAVVVLVMVVVEVVVVEESRIARDASSSLFPYKNTMEKRPMNKTTSKLEKT